MHRTFVATFLGVVGTAALAVQAWGQHPNCISPAPSCVSKVPCGPDQPRGGPPEKDVPREGPPEETVETGVYVAPPRTGALQGPTRRLGIQGMSITFPQVKLTAPHLEFPNLVRSHTEARMLIDQAQAPYVRTGYQTVSTGSPEAPRDTPRDAPRDCEEELREMREKYEQLENRAAQMERLLEQQRDLMDRAIERERSPGSCTGRSANSCGPDGRPLEHLPPTTQPGHDIPPPTPGRTQIQVAPNPVTPASYEGYSPAPRQNVVREPVRTPALMRLPPVR